MQLFDKVYEVREYKRVFLFFFFFFLHRGEAFFPLSLTSLLPDKASTQENCLLSNRSVQIPQSILWHTTHAKQSTTVSISKLTRIVRAVSSAATYTHTHSDKSLIISLCQFLAVNVGQTCYVSLDICKKKKKKASMEISSAFQGCPHHGKHPSGANPRIPHSLILADWLFSFSFFLKINLDI